MKYIQNIAIVIALVLGGAAFLLSPSEAPAGGDSIKFVGGSVYTLKGSGVSSSATSVDLSSFTIPQSGQKLQTADFGDIGYGTLEPGSASRQEIVSFTGVTQNGDGSATLTGVTRGLSPISPYTASTTLQFTHSGGSRFIVSNAPQLFDEGAFKDNDETITGQWTFNTVLPSSTLSATTSNQFTNKTYVDNVANQGAATSTETVAGIAELATQIEMASSTDNGANSPLVLQAKYATSTPDGTSQAGLFSVISKNNGKLSQLWLDLTEEFSFSNLIATNATTTNATTTNLTISGVVSSFLKTDASGVVSGAVAGTDYNLPSYTFATTTRARATDGAFATTTAFTIPANITTASSTINVRANVSGSEGGNGSGTCVFYLRESSGAEVFNQEWTILNLTDDNVQGSINVDILADNSTSAQTILGHGIFQRVKSINAIIANYYGAIDTTSALDFTSSVSLVGVVEAQLGAGTLNCDINDFWIKVN